jgi:hypothetical protein
MMEAMLMLGRWVHGGSLCRMLYRHLKHHWLFLTLVFVATQCLLLLLNRSGPREVMKESDALAVAWRKHLHEQALAWDKFEKERMASGVCM